LPGIGPGRTPGHEIDLLQNVAHNLVRFVLFTQLVQLRHDLCERAFDIADSSLRVELSLRVETTLTAYELFSVKIGKGMQDPIAGRR
jgi:hypothetical protein